MKLICKLPAVDDIKKQLPLSDDLKSMVIESRKEISDIISWKSNKKLLIIWPCSMDFEESILEYAKQLKKISDEYKDHVYVVMRTYTSKPRSVVWWKWMIYNWEFWSWWDINEWIKKSRKIIIDILKLWLPVTDEMLYPNIYPYFDDIFSYMSIWARSCENQIHREVSSLLTIPVWIKNPISGDLNVLINSLISVRSPQQVLLWNNFYMSDGNPNSHIILRWSNWFWESVSNIEDIPELDNLMSDKKIKSWIIVDLNHDNSWKDWSRQLDNLRDIMKMKNKLIRWFMVESYIEDWNQKIWEDSKLVKRWLSLTDSCIWLNKTKQLFLELYSGL